MAIDSRGKIMSRVQIQENDEIIEVEILRKVRKTS